MHHGVRPANVDRVIVEIRGVSLPGRQFACYDNVHVGVQCQAEVVDLVPGDADSATWTFDVMVKDGPDYAGPYVHGKKGDRFFYLSWGTVAADGGFTMFRRAKLMLDAVDVGLLDPNGRLVCTLALTGGDGSPVCAAKRPPQLAWSAG
jgi:hypothetical protein